MQLGNFHKKSLGQSIASRNHLVGKVVLLIGNDTPVLNTLVIQLAQKGADIALFCRRQSTEALQNLKQQVEALGQRFFLFSENGAFDNDEFHSFVTSVKFPNVCK